VGLCNKDSLWF
jgi:hypothetical protein